MFKRLLLCSTIGLISTIQAQTLVTAFTSKGNFELEIYDNLVPITGGNFLDLVNEKYYDGIIFHRVIDNFMIQGGDPTGTGNGGPGYSIADEFHSDLSNVKKTISMANSGPNTGGSQFFINLVNNTFLDHDKAPSSSKHPVFGKVTENFSVVQDIGNVSTNGSDKPLVDVVIDSIRVGSLQILSTEENKMTSDIVISPNPILPTSILELDSKTSEKYQIMVVNQLGQVLVEKSVLLQAGQNNLALNEILVENMKNGLYFLQLSSKTTEQISIPFSIEK